MEIWKDIENFNNLYQVSNFGNINSIRRSHLLMGVGNSRKTNWYLRVNLVKDKKIRCKYIHRLVAKAFIQNPENKPCVNHKDGNKINNHVDNLEWVTHKENTRHAWKNGLMENARVALKNNVGIIGERNHNSKLLEKDVLEIRKKYNPGSRWSPGVSIYDLADEYGVSKSKIYQIICRQCWKHI